MAATETHTVPTFSAAQLRAAEQPLLEACESLMARAAAALADVAMENVEPRNSDAPTYVLVLAGSGNNGGDALFAAALMAATGAGVSVEVVTLSDRWHEAGLAAAVEAGAHRISPDEAEGVDYDLVLDGVLGIGTAADPRLRGRAREIVETLLPQVSAGRTRVIAVDIPSGLHPDTGAADDAVLPARITVTFGAVKHGLVAGRGPELAGEIVLVRIGIEQQLADILPCGTTRIARVVDSRR